MKRAFFLIKIRIKRLFSFFLELPEALFALFLIFITIVILFFFEKKDGFVHNYLPGTMLDIAIFGILIVSFNKLYEKRREKKLNIQRWQEEIDDFRLIYEPIARARIVGNIYRLNSVGFTAIDLSLCNLEHTVFGSASRRRDTPKLISLRGSDLSYASLEHACFALTDLRDIDWNETILKSANIAHSNLTGAKNLTVQQFSDVGIFIGNELDPELEAQIREKYPHLIKDYEQEDEDRAWAAFVGGWHS